MIISDNPFWEASQNNRIDKAKRDNDALKHSLKNEIDYLHKRIDQLLLINEALWELVSTKTGLKTEALRSKISELDLHDGVEDGKLERAALECKNCGRTVDKRLGKCIFCGEKYVNEDVFGV